MSFLAVDAQKSLLILQRNQLQFEQALLMRDANAVQREMKNYAESKEDGYDLDSDATYIELQEQEERIESGQDALDSQLQLLDTEIQNLKSMVQNNIKNSCAINLIQ